MFVVVYQFDVRDGLEKQFILAWTEVTQGIYRHKGSLGSRLHRTGTGGTFIAYAQWPDRDTWKDAAATPIASKYDAPRRTMRESLKNGSAKILHELEVEVDYLQSDSIYFH